MPRQSRIDTPGAMDHIVICGIERRKIFKSDDCHNFLERLGLNSERSNTQCYAWPLISSHLYLNLLKAGSVDELEMLDKFSFNGHGKIMSKHKHLWQNREEMLPRFGDKRDPARRWYKNFVAKGVAQSRRMI